MSVGYHSARQWLSSRIHLGIRPGLSRVQTVLAGLNHPERQSRFVHVAGTNGKGSVSMILAELLNRQMRVGLFTSPGEQGLQGQFEILGESVPEDIFEKLAQSVRQAEGKCIPGNPLTHFEAITVMAFLYFAWEQPDVVVLEAGLGGRLDSTNVVCPMAAVITNVSLDHQKVLGNTLSAIALEKSGIMKQGVPVITAAKGEGLHVLSSVAKQRGCTLKKHQVHFDATLDGWYERGQILSYRGLGQDFSRLKVPFFASYQAENTAVALATYEVLVEAGEISPLSTANLRQTLERVRWPGRFDVRWRNGRPIIVDGAHNPAGSRKLKESLKAFSELWEIQETDWVCVLGVLGDKDVLAVLYAMRPFLQRVILCKPENERAMSGEQLAELLKKTGRSVDMRIIPDVGRAVHAAMKEHRPVCCFGSLYTVEQARKAIDTDVS